MKKKQALSSTFVWLKDVGLKVFAILALVIGGFYAYAAISWPSTPPNPTTGVVGMFVGKTEAAYSGTVVGYEQANSLCSGGAGDLANSHVCTPDEMINSYNHSNSQSPIIAFAANAASPTTLWINNGPPAYEANANDCGGWRVIDPGNASSPNYGTVWNFSTKAGILKRCGLDRAFACCK